jgi:hypothetical protein
MTRKPPAQAPPRNAPRLALALPVSVKEERKGRCEARTKAGAPCPQWAMKGQKRCAMHVPGNAVKFGQRGGMRRTVYSPDGLTPFAPPSNAREQAAILAQLEVETHQGKIDPKVASTISTLANAYLGALELIEFGEKLKELEARVGIADPLSSLARDATTGRFVEQ